MRFLCRYEVIIPGVVFAATFAVCAVIEKYHGEEFASVYEKSMRASLFTGFFTLSGFLLSAKTFLVLNMKKEVYATKHYLRLVRDRRKSLATNSAGVIDSADTLDIYKPLKEIGDLLIANVGMTLATAILQFTLGLWHSPWVAGFCLSVAAASVALLAFSLNYMSRNLNRMYQHFESEAEYTILNDKLD